MAFPRARRLPLLLCAVGVVALAGQGRARAGNNDLRLLNLCPYDPITLECSWIQRTGGQVTKTTFDVDAQTRFRSLMSELGFAIAPRVLTPADTLGFAGFQFSAELGITNINSERKVGSPGNELAYWNGVETVDPTNLTARRPDSRLTTVGGFVRKGLWIPLPAFEFGAGALSIVGTRMYVLQGYAKLALQEGFHGWWLPSFAVRGGASQLLGTSEVDLTVYSVDLLVSKAFDIGGTARIEPFLGWSMLFIKARSGVIDATPNCDAFAAPGGPPPTAECAASQAGRGDDVNANFQFLEQDVITRQRFFGGFKLKMSVLFLAAQAEFALAGTSRDNSQAVGAADRSGAQQTYSLSAGFDF
jgi:hypothetical protein